MNPKEFLQKEHSKTFVISQEESDMISYGEVFKRGYRPKKVDCSFDVRNNLVITTTWVKSNTFGLSPYAGDNSSIVAINDKPKSPPISKKKQKSIAEHMRNIRERHREHKPECPFHDVECPACNNNSALTWDQYKYKSQVWYAARAEKIFHERQKNITIPSISTQESIPNHPLKDFF